MALMEKLRRGQVVETEAPPASPRLGLGGALAGTMDPDPSRDLPEAPRPKRRLLRGFGRVPSAVTDTVTDGGTGTARVLTRLTTGLLLVCVASGPAAIAWRVLSPAQQQVSASTSSADTLRVLSRRSVASETAAAWVSTWLTSSQTSAAVVKATYPHLAPAVQLPKSASTVSDVRVVDAIAPAPGVWSVTVSARVTPAGGAAATRYYQVPVSVEGELGSVAAHPMAQPAAVAGPVASPARESSAYVVAVSADSTVGTAVSAGLDAMLTGRGELSRYTTPGSALRPLEVPFSSIALVEIRADRRTAGVIDTAAPPDADTLHVTATVLVADGKTRVEDGQSVTYPLTLTARGGRWEITAIDRALRVNTGSAATQSPSAPAPQTTASPTK